MEVLHTSVVNVSLPHIVRSLSATVDEWSQLFLGLASGLFFHQGFDWSTARRRGLGVLHGMLWQQAALISFIEAFRIMGFLFLATVPLVLPMRSARHRCPAPAAAC